MGSSNCSARNYLIWQGMTRTGKTISKLDSLSQIGLASVFVSSRLRPRQAGRRRRKRVLCRVFVVAFHCLQILQFTHWLHMLGPFRPCWCSRSERVGGGRIVMGRTLNRVLRSQI